MKRFIYTLGIGLLLGGCSTIDRTENVSSVCPVHSEEMTIETLNISPGYLGYIPEYGEIMNRDFPNYSGTRWAHAEYQFGARKMNAYVCDSCTEAYLDYNKKQKEKEAQPVN
jgi:hypothetical protein